MNLSPAKTKNLPTIMSIIQDAQIYLASQNIDQWQDGYPDEKRMLQDISQQESFIVKNEHNDIMGTTMFTTKAEPTYSNIDGSWLTAKNVIYGVIHRMAVSNNFRKLGVAKFIFKQCEQRLKENKIASMRIDTHEDNKDMQGLLKKLDYVYCGIIFLDDGDKRLAFEKLIK
jgi:ribosomal protein S18 acetylase RimI-like enzyme